MHASAETEPTPGRMTYNGATTVNRQQIDLDRPGVAAYLASGELAAEIAALLGRWTGRQRPAILVVLDWETPFADVYAEDELLEVFPDASFIHAGPISSIGPGTLLIFVIDEEGEAAYAIPDPRALN
jgi:hypothetical protein